ncbi:MAG: HlyC/CorC family transporter [Alphaproteobacteria bacterium]|nr:HlyC/CorC family transporter [Alphaproteobacteria bacterium]
MDDASTPIFIVAIALLLLISGFFSGSETALTAASRPRLHELEKRGDRRARAVNRLRARQERLIGGILVGNNLVNIAASALATSLAISWFGDAGVAVATAAMTLLVLVVAEVMPKTYALRNADRLALVLARPLGAVIGLLAPLTVLVQQIVRAILFVFGATLGYRESDAAREEELRGAIDLHARSDDEAATEGYMLRNILDMGEVEVGEIMTHRTNLEMIDAGNSAEAIVAQVLESPYTRLPVYRDDPENVIGVLHAKELFRAVQENGTEGLVIAKLASLPWFIPESTSLHNQLHAFRRRREHFAVVVDEYGALMGVVTLEDILEEIVGEIDDEHDLPVAGVRQERDGSFVIDGTVTIRELNREFGWNLPDEPAATIAGLVLHEARLIPDVGQSFAFHGFRFDILHRSGNQITSIRMSPRPTQQIAEDATSG